MIPNNLDKYREEAVKKFPDMWQPSGKWGSNAITDKLREAHMAARLLSEQAIADAFEAGKQAAEEYFENDYYDNGAIPQFSIPASVKAEYLSTHTPPLLNLEALLSDAMDRSFAVGTRCTYTAEQWQQTKQQYITEKLKSL